ncbi:MAG: 2,3,4,5-tetrahydropyridine-2,6-dicarboxylate N-succinyltransferase, partial [Archangium sp.]|nr:2,3,4,5-tetrahydropyridine-2,6-dicarboxylate N-succinyltransferase [Archangium sp.]
MNLDDLKARVSAAFAEREKLKEPFYAMAVKETVALLDRGVIRVAQKGANAWEVNAWVKEAILCFFAISEMKTMELPPFEFHDKIPLKKDLADAGVR